MSDTKDFSEDRTVPMSAASPAPEVAPVQKTDVMSAVRQAKKRKAEQDRDALSDLRKQVGSLADAMSNKPEVVTRPQKDDEASVPSMYTEFARTALVGLLGLGTFYISNVWAKRPKLMVADSPPPAAPPVVAPTVPSVTPVTPATPVTPTPAPAKKAGATHFIDMKPPPPKRKIGLSGLYE